MYCFGVCGGSAALFFCWLVLEQVVIKLKTLCSGVAFQLNDFVNVVIWDSSTLSVAASNSREVEGSIEGRVQPQLRHR